MVKLSRALICLDCELIYDQSQGITCPECLSKTVWPVGKWIKPCVQKLNIGEQRELLNKSKEVV